MHEGSQVDDDLVNGWSRLSFVMRLLLLGEVSLVILVGEAVPSFFLRMVLASNASFS